MEMQPVVSVILDILPVALCGITHVDNTSIGEVRPKLNIMLT